MPLYPTWEEISLRLTLTMIASAVIGFNRGSRGHAAGLRTTILVGLAASVAMIQANVLLSVGGRTAASFGVMDLMRLPLGILTGVGFIGGGAILRKGDLVTGVTTAATLWMVTVIGLCLGGGQLELGTAATVLGVITLSVLKWIDIRIPREHRATLVIQANPGIAFSNELPTILRPLGYNAQFHSQNCAENLEQAAICFEIDWRKPEIAGPPLDLLAHIGERYKVLSFTLSSEAAH